MLNLPDLNNRIRWLMIAELEESEADGTLFVPNFLTPEGREDYSSMFRSAILQSNEEWLTGDLLGRGLVASSEAPGRVGGAAARPVQPEVIAALVRGEYNRLYCRALSKAAMEDNVPEVQVFRAEGVGNSTSVVGAYEGRTISTAALFEGLRNVTLEAYLGVPQEHRQAVLSVRLPRR